MNTENNLTPRSFGHWLCWPSLVFAVYTHGYYERQVLLQEMAKKQAQQEHDFAQINQAHRQAQHALVAREYEVQFEQQSQEQTRALMAQQQEQLNELQTELVFYRNVIAPEKGEQGIRINEFVLGETLDQRRFDYRLSLTQFKTRQYRVKGKISMFLHGTEQGKAARWPISLSHERQSKLNFEFNYFAEFAGEILLPPEAKPERLVVKIERQSFKTGKTLERQESSYPLNELLSDDALARLEQTDLVAIAQ